jgi:hypothetical protein
MPDAVLLEHKRTNAVLLKLLAYGESGLPGSDHHHLMGFGTMCAVEHE